MGKLGSLPEDRIVEMTIEDLHGSRVRVRGKVDRYAWRIRLKNAKLEDYGELLVKDQVWLTRGKWAEKVGIGDIIQFEARLGKRLN